MTNPNLVRKPALDSGTTGEVSKSDILSTSLSTQNYIINGNMRISQRGNSFPAIANGAYSIDRWRYAKAGTVVHTVSSDSDVPTLAQAGQLFTNSYRANLTTPDTSIGATDLCCIQQMIEGYNWAQVAQKVFTISFWVKATLTGTYCVGLQNNGLDRCAVQEYTINTSNTWEYKSLTFPASPSTGSWNYDTGVGIYVQFILAAGTNFQTTAGTWNTGNFFATANQINGVNTGATDFRVTGVILNEGSTAAAFSTYGRTFDQEYAACQRYYEKSHRYAIAPGASMSDNDAFYWNGGAAAATAKAVTVIFKVSKRTTPTFNTYDQANNSGKISEYGTGGSPTANAQTPSFLIGEKQALVLFVTGATGTGLYFGWTADAEL